MNSPTFMPRVPNYSPRVSLNPTAGRNELISSPSGRTVGGMWTAIQSAVDLFILARIGIEFPDTTGSLTLRRTRRWPLPVGGVCRVPRRAPVG